MLSHGSPAPDWSIAIAGNVSSAKISSGVLRRRSSSAARVALRCRSEEDVAEPGAVAEAPQLGAKRRAMRTVLGARDVGDISHPPHRASAAHEPVALAAPNSRGVFVAVVARLRRDVAQKPVASTTRAGPVDHERARPALAECAQEVAPDVRVPSRAEADVRDTAWPHAPPSDYRLLFGGGAIPLSARFRARAGQALAVDAVTVRVTGVRGALRSSLIAEIRTGR